MLTEVRCTKRDVWDAFDALTVLVEHGYPDHHVALNLGATFHRVQEAREEIERARTVLVNAHARRDEEGNYVRVNDGNVTAIAMVDPPAFQEEWRALLAEAATIRVSPISLDALGDPKKTGQCPRCKRPMGVQLLPPQLEVLVRLGIIETTDNDTSPLPLRTEEAQ